MNDQMSSDRKASAPVVGKAEWQPPKVRVAPSLNAESNFSGGGVDYGSYS